MLDDFLKESAQAGVAGERGAFTISPERARRKLADSVPSSLRDPWTALALLLDGVELGFGWRLDQGSPISIYDAVVVTKQAGIDLWLTGDTNAERLQAAFEVLQRVGEQPLSSTDPAEVSLSRGLLALTKLGISCYIRVGRFHQAWSCQGDSEKTVAVLAKDRGFRNAFGRITVGPHPKFTDHYNQGSKARPSVASKIAPHRRKTTIGLGPRPSLSGRTVSRANWYDYRTRYASLLESFHHGPRDSLLRVDAQKAIPPGSYGRVNQDKSAWERFVLGRRTDVFLRQWGPEPPSVEPFEDNTVALRAELRIGLTDDPSWVEFLGPTRVEKVLQLPDVPYGLSGNVWWPTLKQSLYGENWVADEEYERAVAWVKEQVRVCFALFDKEFDYIHQLIQAEHSKRSYRNEVSKKLQEWRASVQRYLQT